MPDVAGLHDVQSNDISGLLAGDFGSEDLFSGSDAPESSSGDLHVTDDALYESDDLNINDDFVTLEEMLEDLQAQLGPDQDKEFWKLRKCSACNGNTIYNSFFFSQAQTSSLRMIATISVLSTSN